MGGGICGLSTALLLARDRHDVTVLERDGQPLPGTAEAAWDAWRRGGVAQFHQPHNLMPGARMLFDAELPELNPALSRAGAATFDLLNPLPPSFRDHSPRAADDRFWTFTARRPVAEWAIAGVAQREPRLDIRRGVKVTGLTTGAPASAGIPHVAGVRTENGDVIAADLVVDAMGRQSRADTWLQGIGARPISEEQAEPGFVYYSRYFCGTLPERRGPALMALGTISLLTLPGDNGTWSTTIFCATGDQPLKALRHEPVWTRVVRACPLQAHWLEGEPITDVLAMAGMVDRYRRFVCEGQPVVTGFVAVADAAACTNPSARRGVAVGLIHARQLRDAVRESADDPRALVEDFDARTEAAVAPWYDAQIMVDRARFAAMDALREGREPGPPAGETAALLGFMSLIGVDPDLFRAGLEYIGTITPVQQILRRPEVIERLRNMREAMKDAPPPPRPPGPDRAQLLTLVKK